MVRTQTAQWIGVRGDAEQFLQSHEGVLTAATVLFSVNAHQSLR